MVSVTSVLERSTSCSCRQRSQAARKQHSGRHRVRLAGLYSDCPKSRCRNAVHFSKALGSEAPEFFLHGYGRCVCREAQVTLIEFDEIAEKIRAREKTEHSKRQPNTKQQTKPKAPTQNKTGSYHQDCEN